MAFKVKYHGVEIECDTVDDAIAIAGRLSGNGASSPVRDTGTIGTASRELVGTRFKELFSNLRDTQKKFLQAIAEHAHGKNDRVLRQTFSLEDNKALGGLVAGISKIAIKSGIRTESLFSVETSGIGEDRRKEYRPTDELRRIGREMGWTIN